MSRSRTERLWLDDGFAAWCAAHPGCRVELIAGAERMHSLLVPEDLPLADDSALQQYARLQFSHYFGATAQQWPLACWQRGAERGVVALAQEDGLATLTAEAAAHRVRIVSLRPSWTLAPSDDGDCVVIDADMLTWLQRRAGRLVTLQQRPASDELLREFEGTPVLSARALLDAPARRGMPDFMPQAAPARALVWVWAGAAAAACALVAVQAGSLADESNRLAEQAELLQRLTHPMPARPASAPSPAARARAWAAARQLDADWGSRWTSLERALPPDLQLQALDLDGRSLRVEGQAPLADAVTQLVDRLALDAAPNEEVVLTRLQRNEAGGGLRFEIVRRHSGGLR
ncbi:MAG: hypothetical protein EKK53_28015 [Burkholderiales bacterium]|nr:MAG: hypothetical protein EKK53_28015 [Burkholderiales bacterium]